MAWWKFDEGSGTTAADASGNGNTATLVSPSWTTGKIGSGALTFGGTKLGTASGSGSLANLYQAGMTVSAWIKPTSNATGRILDKDNNDVGWFFGMTSVSQINFTSDQDSSGVTALTSSTSIASITLNTWQHVLVTWDGTAGSSHVHLYINGVQADGSGTSGTGPEVSDSTTPLNIGNRQVDSARPFPGSIDDVRIYNRVLSPTEIQALADATAPGAPSGLVATPISGAQINLSWTAATDNIAVTGYLVERCQGASCTTFAQIATPTTTSYSDTGLTASTSYSYRVRATDGAGNLGTYSSTASTATMAGGGDTQAPTAPGVLTATAASSSTINLSWAASTDNVGVTGYRVERCQGASCTSFAQIATPTATSYSDTGLSASTGYSYRVRATDAAGNLSTYSTAASATTQSAADTTPPSSPTGLTVTAVSASQINLSWTASTDDVGVVGYQIEGCQGTSCTTFAQLGVSGPPVYSASGLSSSTAYLFRVRATDAAGNLSGYSNIAGATTSDPDPTAPTGLTTHVVSETEIDLSWTAPDQTANLDGYPIERCMGVGCSDFAPIAEPNATSFSDTGLVAGTSYSYRVRALTDEGEFSSYTNVSSAVTQGSPPPADTSPPSAPASVSASTASANVISISWSAATDDVGVTGYLLEDCAGAGCTDFAPVATLSATRYVLASLPVSTTYRFRVRATDAAGNIGPYSGIASAMTAANGNAICD